MLRYHPTPKAGAPHDRAVQRHRVLDFLSDSIRLLILQARVEITGFHVRGVCVRVEQIDGGDLALEVVVLLKDD